MTQESPERPPSDPIFCADCNTVVRLESTANGYDLRCACGTGRSLTPVRDLPAKWSV